MPIPDFQKIFRPLLQFASDGQSHSLPEAYEYISRHFNMTEKECSELLPSGRQTTIKNRVGWSRTYLAKAGLLSSPRRSYFVITDTGKDFLKKAPQEIRVKHLMEFEEFRRFHDHSEGRVSDDGAPSSMDAPVQTRTPEEVIETAYQSLNSTLSSTLLDTVLKCSPEFFEKMVVDLLVKMGYGGSKKEAGKATRLSSDGGVDGIINEDRLGLDSIYIQAKRWKDNVVQRPEIQKFAGALQGFRAKKGVFITTSTFSEGAWEFVKLIDSRIVLIDGERLTDLMIEHEVGVAPVITYQVKRVDSDYFEEE